MLTVQRTTSVTLDTPEAIAAHLAAAWAERSAAAPFQHGDMVRARTREGLPPDLMIGDVGVVLICDPTYGPHTTVLCAHRAGLLTRAEVPTANLDLILVNG